MMKTVGEIESAACTAIARFEQEYLGRGPKDIHAYLIGDMLIVHLKGVLMGAERSLSLTLPSERGRDLLKQVRTQLIETARPNLEAIVLEVTGSATVSLHHDLSTVASDEILVFILAEAPVVREPKRK